MLSDTPPPTTKRPSGAPFNRRDLVANSILQMDMDNELDTFTADIDCLADSSDEEEESQPPAAKGGTKGSGEGQAQDKAASEIAHSSSGKKGKKDAEEGEDDEGEVGRQQRCLWSAACVELKELRSSCCMDRNTFLSINRSSSMQYLSDFSCLLSFLQAHTSTMCADARIQPCRVAAVCLATARPVVAW